MKPCLKISIIIGIFSFFTSFRCDAQKSNDILFEKEFTIISINKDTIYNWAFKNAIIITATEVSQKKKHLFKKKEESIYNIFIDIDSIEKYAINLNDFLLKVKPGNNYEMMIERKTYITAKDNIQLNVYNGIATKDEKNGKTYHIDKVYFLKDIKL